MHRGACKYACGRTNEPTNDGIPLPPMKLDLRDSALEPDKRTFSPSTLFGSDPTRLSCRKKDGSIRRNNQRSSRNHFAAIERPSFPHLLFLLCATKRDLTHSMHLRVRILRPLNPRTWCIRLTTHSGSQNVSLELSTARPRTFRGVYGITRDTMNNSDNEMYMCMCVCMCMYIIWNFY